MVESFIESNEKKKAIKKATLDKETRELLFDQIEKFEKFRKSHHLYLKKLGNSLLTGFF